ncbi:VirD4-like conjugal transfer protein, CD1115 family, partial [Streptococcus sobrinus]|uniref:VirD4-like conjugal transfer protein, CD1115 family n=1 Tax=Streptococcus sobrinus TaxID=1310 RepID=UPI000681B62A
MERQKKPKLFYVIIGVILALFFHRVVAIAQIAPISKGTIPIFGQVDYIYNHFLKAPYFYWNVSPIALGAIALGFIIALLMALKVTLGGTFRTGEEAGSARFATAKELMGFRDEVESNNMILTKNSRMGLYNKWLPYEWQLNKNVLVVGGPGSGKTFTFVKPNIMQMNGSYVVTDPKGLLVHEVGHMLEKNGYNVKVFDLVHLTNSDTFNPFHYMKSELDIDRISEAIIDGTKRSDNQGENFWVQANLLLTRALIGYLYFDSQVRGYTPNLSMVSDLLRNLQRTDEKIPSPVEILFNQLEASMPGNYACRQWQLFNANFQAETRTSVLAVMSAQYSVFDHDDVTNIISNDSLEMETWQTQKTAVFIAIPETDKSFNFLASTLFAVMFNVLTHNADDIIQGKRPGYSYEDLLHVQLIIDEFANIGKIPNFNEVLASVRSREISIKPIIQAVNQIQSLYKNDWKTIFNNCATVLLLDTNDEDTMKYFSMRAGKQTIKQQDYSENRGPTKSGSTSYRSQQRDLLTPDEVARIGVNEALVFISKQNVFKDNKASVFDHPMKKLLADSPSDKENWYDYTRPMTDIDEFLLAVDDPSAIEEIDSGLRKQVDQEFDQELGPLIDGREVATTA